MENSQPGPAVSEAVLTSSPVRRSVVAAYLARFKGQFSRVVDIVPMSEPASCSCRPGSAGIDRACANGFARLMDPNPYQT